MKQGIDSTAEGARTGSLVPAQREHESGTLLHIYQRHRTKFRSTQSRQVPIGERRKPDPKGKPGYLRVDTVYQGNKDGKAGLYHITAVDTVTQWQVIGCVETISERHLLPVLRQRFGVRQLSGG